MPSRLTEWYSALQPDAKKRIFKSAFWGALVFMAVMFVIVHKGQMKPLGKEQKELTKKSVSLNNNILEKTMSAENDETRKRLAVLEAQYAENNKAGGTNPIGSAVLHPRSSSRVPNATLTGTLERVITAKQNTVTQPNPANRALGNQPVTNTHTQIPRQPLSENRKTKYTVPKPPGEFGNDLQDSKVVRWTYGGKIDSPENTDLKKSATESTSKSDSGESKKKEKSIVHIPVGFMPARTLNGLLVPATNDGKGDPHPLIVRVSASAVLPNENSSKLGGCFFVTEAIGSLQQSRALCRLVSLTCLDKKGQSVLETDIRGFIEDADGKPGLSGIVAAPKFGELVRLSAAAGFLSGIGDGMSLTSATNTISSVGPLTSYGTTAQDIGIAAAGKGISNATKKINDVYSDLLHQSLPVVEVGNGKKVTIWVTKGVDVEIKSFKNLVWY